MKDDDQQTRSLLEASEKNDYSSLSDAENDADPEQALVESDEEPGDELFDGPLPIFTIICILSTAFSYGCILTTLFIITLPIECERINKEHPDIPKSVALGNFVAIAGVTQLVSPLVGRLSDTYVPPAPHEIGQRLPYLVFGSVCTVVGLLIQAFASYRNFWVRYSLGFFLHMIGLNIMYSMMIALIPDQVPHSQTGVSNGILALLLVTGSLFGFGLFHSLLSEHIESMYGLYTCIVIVTTILTCTHAHERDAELAFRRTERRRLSQRALSPVVTVEHKSLRAKINKRARAIVLTPTIILKSVLVDPIHKLDWATLWSSYTIDTEKHHDFFIVTVSRLFYYCGLSAQTFFLYFVHDIIHVRDNPESVVASLAILSQVSGAFTCYPVGVLSDRWMHGQRKPFVYLSCVVLSGATFSLIFAQTLHEMVIVCLVLGAANGIYLTMDTSLAVDTLPHDLQEDEENGSAQLLGVWGVAAFLGSAIGPMIGGPLLYIFGSQTVVDDKAKSPENGEAIAEEYTLTGYAVVLSLSSFYFLCSAFSLRFINNTQG